MNLRGWYTLFYKETLRFYKVLLQTVVAPIVTALLYLVIFAHAIARHVDVYPGVGYAQFLIPGLMMMSMIQNAFANSASSLIQSKVTGNLIFVLLTPLSPGAFLTAFVAAATVRALVVGVAIYVATLPFVTLPLAHPLFVALFALIAAGALGCLGLIAAIWADKFDQLAGFQNFLIMPLSFLAGVFYSVHSLPPFWFAASHLNPFFYMVDGFRYGFFGQADVPPALSLAVAGTTLALVATITWLLLARGYKLRD